MKMAKPSEQDIEAGGQLMALLNDIDSGYYPFGSDDDDAPMFFDEDDKTHLRQFYDAVKANLDSAPGWQGRVIGGMCFVIMYAENEIVDPDSDVIEFHPKIVKALELAQASAPAAADEVRDAARYRVLRQHVAPRDVSISMTLPVTDVPENQSIEERIDMLCDIALRTEASTGADGSKAGA